MGHEQKGIIHRDTYLAPVNGDSCIEPPSFTPVPKPEKKEKKKPKFIKRKAAAKKKKRKKKIRYLPVHKLKDMAWKVISRYVRAVRDAAPDQIGMSVCYTCGVVKPWPEMQAGHYESRVNSSTRLELLNLASQCPSCNLWRKGNLQVYAKNLVRDHGAKILERLADMNMKPHKWVHSELVATILKYERKLTEAGIDCPARPKQLTVE
jgi:hypothetical protein